MKDYAWHFVGKTLYDGTKIPQDGVWLARPGPYVMCKSGLHASRTPFAALQYAPGEVLCRVEVREIAQEDPDKLVCASRRILARMDVSELCSYFARMQALSVIHLWDAPEVVLDWLMTGDVQYKSAARSATRSAAESAAWSASWSAAWSAAWSAIESVTGSTAWRAAESAAAAWRAAESATVVWSATGSAAWSASWKAARAEFDSLVYESFQENRE
ncbi:MAG: hypothetical protein DDT20_00834 [Firmicutes bacterium]|nr:hypothetical protein [Bacillota bacterium]